MSKIFIIEDDENIRELVLYALNSNGFETEGFEDPLVFFEYVKKNTAPICDLLLLDIMLPNIDGLTVLKKIRDNEKIKDINIIMLTAKGSEFDKVKGLDLGADDYVSKPFGVIELLARIKAVLRRNSSPSKNILQFGLIYLDKDRHIVKVNDENIVLTLKEYELLYYLLINLNNVLTRDKLLDNIWGYDYQGESRTVDMHIKTLRQKLGIASDYIKTIRGVGYKLGE